MNTEPQLIAQLMLEREDHRKTREALLLILDTMGTHVFNWHSYPCVQSARVHMDALRKQRHIDGGIRSEGAL